MYMIAFYRDKFNTIINPPGWTRKSSAASISWF